MIKELKDTNLICEGKICDSLNSYFINTDGRASKNFLPKQKYGKQTKTSYYETKAQ